MILKPYDRNDGKIIELRRLLHEVADPLTRQDIEREINFVRSGSTGEEEAAKHIRRIYGKDETVGVFHNLNIPEANETGSRIEIDCLIIDGPMRRSWVLEIKNWSGTVGKDENESWWQKGMSGNLAVMESPVSQARAGRDAIQHWFRENDCPIREVYPIVAFAPRVHLDRSNITEEDRVMKIDDLERWRKIEDGDYSLWTKLSRIRENRKQKFQKDELEQLRDKLLSSHRDMKLFYRSKFGMSPPSFSYSALPPSIAINPQISLELDVPASRYKVIIKNDPNRDLARQVWRIIRNQAKWDPTNEAIVVPDDLGSAVAEDLRDHFK